MTVIWVIFIDRDWHKILNSLVLDVRGFQACFRIKGTIT